MVDDLNGYIAHSSQRAKREKLKLSTTWLNPQITELTFWDIAKNCHAP